MSWTDGQGWGAGRLEESPARHGESRQGRERVWNDWDWDGRGPGTVFAGGGRAWRPTSEQMRSVRAAEMSMLHRLLAACEGCVQGWRPLVELAPSEEAKVRCVACVRLVDACAVELAQMLAADDEFADVSVPRERSRTGRNAADDQGKWKGLVTEAEERTERACRAYEGAESRTGSLEMRELTARHRVHMESVLDVVREMRGAARAAEASESRVLAASDSEAGVIP